MAHFAKLDENNVVLEVLVVRNEDIDPLNEEASGIAFFTDWSGGYTNWKQTSYTASIRKNYACKGGIYDPIRDAFIAPKPYPSWILNESTCRWEPPAPAPTDGALYNWNESTLAWGAV